MRTRIIVATLALALGPIAAGAQEQTTTSNTGTIDFGVRGTSLTGDAARYERYRDLGDGLFLDVLRLESMRNGWFLNFMADHAGRRDQRFFGQVAQPGKLRGWFLWDQIPMLMSRTTRTLFVEDFSEAPSILTIPDAIQAAGQVSGNNLPGLFEDNAQLFDLRTRRHIAEGGVEYLATPEITVKAVFRNTDRAGSIPYGGSFGHGNLVETIAPTNHTLRDFDAGAEYSRDPVLLRAGYTGSWFDNSDRTPDGYSALTFDNPFRGTDASNASSRGRLALPPSNSFMGVNGTASVKLPYRSRVTAYISTGSLKDAGDPIMPLTINTLAPAQLPLERSTVEGEARTTAFNLTFSSRPSRYMDFNVKYRAYDYDNRTPELGLFQRSSYDNGISTLSLPSTPTECGAPLCTEPFGVLRQTFDADFRVLPRSGMNAGVGFSRVREERTHRIFEATTDNVLRLTFDSVSTRYFSVRTRYEHAQKRGDGFDEEMLTSVSEQVGMRHFDVADRDRDRVTLIGSVLPTSTLALNVSVAAGNDDYLDSLFGLRDNNHRVYGVGFDATPNDRSMFGASYSFENYLSLSRSRQSSPNTPTGCENAFPASPGRVPCQFYDPARNWATDGSDKVHSLILNAELNQIAEKLDIRFGYDYNRARSTYNYILGAVVDRTLPEEAIDVIPTLDQPTQLPDVKSDLNRATLDALYSLTERLGIGFSYWYERYTVDDFALDAESTPNLARNNAVLLGYLYRPYTANTFWGRLVYRW
jgi:MtrB/PioB family decaheme-associated outer membrane protein